jgi:hypothetical protein
MLESSPLIPETESGVQTNTESYTEFSNEAEAQKYFPEIRDRLAHVNQWHDLAGAATARFQLTDAKGKEVDRSVEEGDHFRIDIPAPGPITGEGHDWVQVQRIRDTENEFTILVRPATNPLNDDPDIAHFFSEESTSSFSVKREGNRIIAGVYGRNEKPNVDAERVVDKIRNAAVAAGAISGFAKIQWKSLVNALVLIEK